MTSHQANDVLTVVGIDFSTDPKKVGIAYGAIAQDRPRAESVLLGKSMQWDDIVDYVVSLIDNAKGTSTLIALDAPLGWPRSLWKALSDHHAGAVLRIDADKMFHRRTDDVVRERVGKKPLEVGADRIARTAHKALWFLNQVRERTGLQVPLSWTPGRVAEVAAIEVYPAATLAGRRLPNQGYKKDKGQKVRCDLVKEFASIVDLAPQVPDELIANDDLLDAALCVVAGFDFVTDDVVEPTDDEMARAKREGWIWFKPGASSART